MCPIGSKSLIEPSELETYTNGIVAQLKSGVEKINFQITMIYTTVFSFSCKTSFLRVWVLSIDRMEKPHILLAYHIFLICHKYYFPLFSIFILSLFLMHFFFLVLFTARATIMASLDVRNMPYIYILSI